MEGLENYSEYQKKVVESIVKNDNGFHRYFLTADLPFQGMLYETEDGIQSVQKSVTASVSNSSIACDVYLYYSDERDCWFFSVSLGTDLVQGFVHFNTVYNSKGNFSFAFINDSPAASTKEITASLPYSNFFLMRK